MATTTNILFVIPSLGTRGTERQLFELLRGLNEPDYQLHVVTLVDTSPCYTDQVRALGIPVTALQCTGRLGYLGAIGRVKKLIKAHDIHIVHGFLNLGSWVGAIAGRWCGVKVIAATLRDSLDQKQSLKYYRAMTTRLAHVFTSNSRAGFNNRYSKWKKNFRVIYNGVDTSRFAARHTLTDTYRNELGLKPGQRCVAMVAALSDHKDYRTYIDAAALLVQRRDDILFISVGAGPKQDDFHTYNAHMGNPVRFLGSRNDVDTLWSVIDISIMLSNISLHEEGLPNSVLESLACGVPAIANNAGGTVEVIDHEQNGYLLDSADPQLIADLVVRWLDDADLYASLSKSAVDKIESTFSYEHYMRIHRALYQELHPVR